MDKIRDESETAPIADHKAHTRLSEWQDEHIAWRRDLHRNPELAFEEHRTSKVVAERLEGFGLEVHKGLAGTGVVGTLRAGTGNRAIGLRADMDALPMQEFNEFEHRSTVDGKMHACGHDGHTTMLLAAARYLSENPEFDGIVHFIFQPAEETYGGGRVMVEDGLFEKFPMEQVFGMHNMPGLKFGEFAVKPGAMMAGTDMFDIEITGRGGHAAMPHHAVDTVVIASQVVTALQSVVARNVDPLLNAVLSVTRIAAGDAYNVLPQKATLWGTVRYYKPEIQELVSRRLREIAQGICSAMGAEAEVRYTAGYPPTVNASEEAELCGDVLADLYGEDKVDRDPAPLMGGEDFAFMLNERPGAYIFAGAGEEGPMVHHPRYDFNDGLIPLGASYWVHLAETCLPKRADTGG